MAEGKSHTSLADVSQWASKRLCGVNDAMLWLMQNVVFISMLNLNVLSAWGGVPMYFETMLSLQLIAKVQIIYKIYQTKI